MSPALAALLYRKNALQTRILALAPNAERRRLRREQTQVEAAISTFAKAEKLCGVCLCELGESGTGVAYGICEICYDEGPF